MPVEENPGILLYTRIRKSPYFYASRQHGVKRYSVYNHTFHPRHYGDPIAEYWHLLNDVTMWDVGVERQIEISGPDAFTFTNMMVPREVRVAMSGRELDADALWRHLALPVLVTFGIEDKILTLEGARHAAALIPGARLSLYDGIGHAPFWEDAPRFNAELAEFVRVASRGGRSRSP